MFKTLSSKIILLIFLANFFYEENHNFLYKRVLYSIWIYWAVFEIVNHSIKSLTESTLINHTSIFKNYLAVYSIFILFNFINDLISPHLNIITLINNPQAMLSAIPVFIFIVGNDSYDLTELFTVLKVICIIFLATWIIELPGRVPYYQGYIASHAILPFFIISLVDRKNLFFATLLIIAAGIFSIFSGYRIILLQILTFSGLFLFLNLFREKSFFKLIIIFFGGSLIFLMLNNLQDVLDIFKNVIGRKDFEGADTRSFLYQELFADLNKYELVIGRGFLGTYFSDYFLMLIQNLDDTGDFYQRFGIEVGFLQLILKGGFIFYFLYTIPLWYVAIKGIFWHAQMKIPFYVSIYILVELLLMFFENIPYFSFQFSVLFLLAGFVFRIMYMDDKFNKIASTQKFSMDV